MPRLVAPTRMERAALLCGSALLLIGIALYFATASTMTILFVLLLGAVSLALITLRIARRAGRH
jgi:hypothetical protein